MNDAAMPSPEMTTAKWSLWALLRFMAFVAIGAWLIRSLFVATFSIPTGSMNATLLPGDYLFVTKWPYGYSQASFAGGFIDYKGRIFGRLPARGDIVVFKGPDGNDWIKRAIGLPGDTIEVRDGRTILNGKALERRPAAAASFPYGPNTPCRAAPGASRDVVLVGDVVTCRYPAWRETLPGGRSYTVLDQLPAGPGDSFGPATIPPGFIFMMGDNRDDSMDSRFTIAQGGIGLVPLDNIVGRATLSYWSSDGSANYAKPWTWFSALRRNRVGETYE
jgi:signal peptidase I